MARTLKEDSGPYAGWMRWAKKADGRFPDTALGPIYWREDDTGSVEVRIDTQRRHTNPGDVLHGGFLMAYADMALYAIAWRTFETVRGATVSCSCEFLGPGVPGEPVVVRGEVIKETGKMIFVRAILSQASGPVLSVSGVLRKIQPRP